MREVASLRFSSSILFSICLLVFPFVLIFGARAAPDTFELTPTENHHIAKLNSNQPYVAGYDAITPDLATFRPVSAITINVNFMSTDPRYFPSGSWLGAGMFVQDQDSHFGFVDYGFYIMLVLDAVGDFFLDVGFHQTRESTAPFQAGTSDLLYAYTWQISGIDPTTVVTLGASWDSEGFLYYSVLANGFNVTLSPINVPSLPNCANIHRQFWSGNMRAGAFPFGHYVYYFQFGVISPVIIADNHWSVKLSNPRLLKKPQNEWRSVDLALSTQGDISYIDWDWMWGGAPYNGVSAQYYQNPLENPYEVIFFYNGKTLPPGTILWQYASSKTNSTAAVSSTFSDQIFGLEWAHYLSIEMMVAIGIVTLEIKLSNLRKKSMKPQKQTE